MEQLSTYLEIKNENQYNITEDIMKVSDSMSLVIMMKCKDGIVCGADSRSTLNDGNVIKSAKDVNKVFNTDKFIIWTFGINQVIVNKIINGVIYNVRQNIEDVIIEVLQCSKTIEEFGINFRQKLVNTDTYTFFIGEKDDDIFKMYTAEINQKQVVFTECDGNILSTTGTEFSYNNTKCNKELLCDTAEKIIYMMIENVENIQDMLLEYQNIAGPIIIKKIK